MPRLPATPSEDPASDLVDRLMYALSNPLRRRLLRSLMQEPGSAKTLSRKFQTPLGNVSYHLGTVLFERCRVVGVIEENQRRGAMEKVYAIKPDAFREIVDWPSVPASLRASVDGPAIGSFLTFAIAAMEAEAGDPDLASAYAWQTVAVDRDGRHEIVAAVEEMRETVRSVLARCKALGAVDLDRLVVGTVAFEASPESAAESA